MVMKFVKIEIKMLIYLECWGGMDTFVEIDAKEGEGRG